MSVDECRRLRGSREECGGVRWTEECEGVRRSEVDEGGVRRSVVE